ncbi:MAG: hypothetical protein ACJA2S_004677, partial [Cyclobacteriaceae bacterium]
NFKPLFKILILFEGPIILIYGVLAVLQQQSVLEMASNIDELQNPFAMMGSMGPLYSVTMALSVIIMASFPAIIFRYVHLYQTKSPDDITFKDIRPTLFKDGGMLFAVIILFLMAFMFGFLFFIFPGIYLFVGLSLAIPVLFFEDKNAFESLSRSLSLIRDNWWSTFGYFFIIYIIYTAISTLFMAPQIGVYVQHMLSSFDKESVFEPMSTSKLVMTMAMTAIGTMGAYLAYSIVSVASCFQYFNLREKKESFGLMQEIDNQEE